MFYPMQTIVTAIAIAIAVGIKGKKCLDYIEVLKKLVDVNIADTQLTQEYYETETEITETEQNQIRYDF